MTRTITIDPVTRIEGHAKITIHLDDAGAVRDARFHVTEFRGFEKFCVGRSFLEMPGITARICGICPVSHLMASAKAGDMILGVTPPPTAVKLRKLMNWAQIVQSHALSFFHLSSPDLLLGMDSDPAARNIMGLIGQYPELARGGIRLRQFGQEVIRILGGKKVHPAWAVPGGVRDPLSSAEREEILARLPETFGIVAQGLALVKQCNERYRANGDTYGDFPSLFMGMVGEGGALEHYDGALRVVNSAREVLEPGFEPTRYRDFIAEAVEPWTYLKFPYFKSLGYEGGAGMYRVGPLARLNVCATTGMPRAEVELHEFRQWGRDGSAVTAGFYAHYARLIEILFALESIEALLDDPQITNTHVRAVAGVNQSVGIGVSEAPRGTLFHEYHVDENGILTDVNLLIATGQNNLAMNRAVKEIAQHYLDSRRMTEGMLNRIEHGIRTFDPCLSCSTHALGEMPLYVQIIAADGTVVEELTR